VNTADILSNSNTPPSMNESGRRSQVAVLRCETYDLQEVRTQLERGIALLGGWQKWVRPEENILLKPNLLAADPPGKAVTTHPAVFQAVAESLQQFGVKITYGDSPSNGTVEAAARKSGLAEVAAQLGMSLSPFREGETIDIEGSHHRHKAVIAQAVLDSDGLISLPKLKTHPLTRLTGAVKNQFGCVVGLDKKMFHAKHPQVDHFAAMLVDLNLYIKPRLYILDAIVAMEGNGPRGGAPRRTGILMISADPVALDATASRLVGLEPEQVPTNLAGQQSGLGVYRLEDIELLGDNWEELVVRDFNLGIGLPGFVIKNIWLRNQIVPRPQIDPHQCKICGLCVNACPLRPPAADWAEAGQEQPPQYNYATCIRCYCCQEVCPEGAITLQVPWLGRIMGRRSDR
jgi:uncharacterized protein (DUF362 family)/Pyruvate/2-oxoacid:ferredoxin oxidoreductase delta subunit